MKKLGAMVMAFCVVSAINAGDRQVAFQTKIAVLDPERCIMQSDEYRDTGERLQKKAQKFEVEIQARAEELKKKSVEHKITEDQFAKERSNIEIDSRKIAADLQKEGGEVQMEIMQHLNDAADQILEEQGWDAWVQKFSRRTNPKCEITDAVLKRMNENYKKSKAASKFTKTEAPKTKTAAPAKKAVA